MITQTAYNVNQTIREQIQSVNIDVAFKLPLNQPTGNFFYDRWRIKEEYYGTIWEDVLSTLPDNIGEARLIKLEPGQAYRSHADIDDRYHFNIQGERSFIIYTGANLIYPQEQSDYWFDMNAGEIHSAVNTGRIDRIQLVVRKLLNNPILEDYRTIIIKPICETPRFEFDELISPWLNKLNKQKLINNFNILKDGVSFNLHTSIIYQLDSIDHSKFNIQVSET